MPRKKKVSETVNAVSDTVSQKNVQDKTTEVEAVSTNKVIVCYNDPHAILFEVTDSSGKKQQVYINGNAMDLRGKDRVALPIGKYGQTVIDADVWEKIKTEYAEMPCIRRGRLFAVADLASAETESENRKNIKSGKEPIDPEKTAATTAPDVTNI